MQREYTITGMTCDGCLAKVKRILNGLDQVQEAVIQREYPQARISTADTLNLTEINEALKEVGNYAISDDKQETALPDIKKSSALPEKSVNTYKPLILIVSFIVGVSLLAQYPLIDFSFSLWTRHFMAGFFLVFSFFKLLNLSGFSKSYRMYDIVAAKWGGWGSIYPFVELALGIAYLINFEPFMVNMITVIVLGVSSIGVIKSNLSKQTIKCACLGDVFNLPMSTVTIIEDLTMVAMAGWMLL